MPKFDRPEVNRIVIGPIPHCWIEQLRKLRILDG